MMQEAHDQGPALRERAALTDLWVSVDGLAIRYVDTGGEGVPILLSSGIGGSLELWSAQLQALGDSLRLIAWDYPGHGLSDMGRRPMDPDDYAAFALALMDALGLDRVVAVGNSLGGAIALRMAGLAPHRIAGLVLASPAMMGPEVFLPFRLMSLPGLGELMTRPGALAVKQQLAALFHDPAVASDDLRQIVWRNVHRPGAARALLATLRQTLTLAGVRKAYWAKSLDLLKSTSCQVLLVHGKADVVLPFRQSVDNLALLRRGNLRLIDRCGHTPQIENAALFNELLTTFVAGL
jgi:pimeloyl-ACP methyl ester carboxylesterase